VIDAVWQRGCSCSGYCGCCRRRRGICRGMRFTTAVSAAARECRRGEKLAAVAPSSGERN
jgi:hypothetical protein